MKEYWYVKFMNEGVLVCQVYEWRCSGMSNIWKNVYCPYVKFMIEGVPVCQIYERMSTVTMSTSWMKVNRYVKYEWRCTSMSTSWMNVYWYVKFMNKGVPVCQLHEWRCTGMSTSWMKVYRYVKYEWRCTSMSNSWFNE